MLRPAHTRNLAFGRSSQRGGAAHRRPGLTRAYVGRTRTQSDGVRDKNPPRIAPHVRRPINAGPSLFAPSTLMPGSARPSQPRRIGDAPRQVHLRMGSTRQARILLKACLGQLLANAPVQSQGEAWLVMAKCEIAEVSLEDPPPSTAQAGGHGGGGDAGGGGGQGQAAEAGGEARVRRGKALRIAVFHLDRAIAMLKRCHDFAGLRESFYLKVRIFLTPGANGGDALDTDRFFRLCTDFS